MTPSEQPSGLANLARAAAGALPFVRRGDTLPDRTLTVEETSAFREAAVAEATRRVGAVQRT